METNNFLPIGEVATGSPCTPEPTKAITAEEAAGASAVIRGWGGVYFAPNPTLPATEQWVVRELLMLFGVTLASAGASLLAAYESHSSPLLLTGLIAACSSTGLSPERQACLEKAISEAERIECNKQSAIDADKKAEASK